MRYFFLILLTFFMMLSYQNCSEVRFAEIQDQFEGDLEDPPTCENTPSLCIIDPEPVTKSAFHKLRKDTYSSNYELADMNNDGKLDLVVGRYEMWLGMSSHRPELGVFGIARDTICWDFYANLLGDCEDLSNPEVIPDTCMVIGGQEYCSTSDIFVNRTTLMKPDDFDNDGDIDLIDFGQFRSYVHYNDGTGKFTEYDIVHQQAGHCWYPFADYVDVNGNGKKDFIYLAATNHNETCAPGHGTEPNIHGLHIALRQGDQFVESQSFTFAESDQFGRDNDFLKDILVYDSNEDGYKDLFVLGYTLNDDEQTSTYNLYRLNGSASGFNSPVIAKTWQYERRSFYDWIATDVNMDGLKDILLSNRNGLTQVLYANGSALEAPEDWLDISGIIAIAEFDIDQNGSQDIAMLNKNIAAGWSTQDSIMNLNFNFDTPPLLIGATKWFHNPSEDLSLIMGGYMEGPEGVGYYDTIWTPNQ